jgi:hypothetical protein
MNCLAILFCSIVFLVVAPFGAVAGEVEARAAYARVNTSECFGGAINPAAVPSPPPSVETPAEPTATPDQSSPFADQGLSDAFRGADGMPQRIYTTDTNWYLAFEWSEMLGTGRGYRPGIFMKPDGTVWFGTLPNQRASSDAAGPGSPEPNFADPCGLRPLGRVLKLSKKVDRVTGGSAISIGEFDANGRLHGFGVVQNPKFGHPHFAQWDYIGFFKAGVRHGWGVSREPRTIPYKYGHKVGGSNDLKTHTIELGEWRDGRLIRGVMATHLGNLAVPLDIGRSQNPAYLFGVFPQERRPGYAPIPVGLGVVVAEGGVFRGQFADGLPSLGRIRAGESRTRDEWVWAEKYRAVPRITKAHLDLVPGDVVLPKRYQVPLAIAGSYERGVGVWTETGQLTGSYEVLDDATIKAQGKERLAAYFRSARFYQDAELRADIVARDQAEHTRLEALVRDDEAKKARGKAASEKWERDSQELARKWAESNPNLSYGGPGSTYTPMGSSPSTSNYETRRSDAIRRDRESNRQLQQSIDRIGKRY